MQENNNAPLEIFDNCAIGECVTSIHHVPAVGRDGTANLQTAIFSILANHSLERRSRGARVTNARLSGRQGTAARGCARCDGVSVRTAQDACGPRCHPVRICATSAPIPHNAAMPDMRPNSPRRTPDWFATAAGHALLRTEAALIQMATRRSRGARALLLAGSGAQGFALPLDISHLTELHVARGDADACLHGDLRCRFDALPFARETFSLIVVWHAESLLNEAVLSQLSELLQPEGELLVLGLNRLSLWRWHWQRYRPATVSTAAMTGALRSAGFDVHHLSGAGSRWPWTRYAKAQISDPLLRSPWMCASHLLLARLRKPGLTLRPALRRRAVTVNASLARVSMDRVADCRDFQDDQAA